MEDKITKDLKSKIRKSSYVCSIGIALIAYSYIPFFSALKHDFYKTSQIRAMDSIENRLGAYRELKIDPRLQRFYGISLQESKEVESFHSFIENTISKLESDSTSLANRLEYKIDLKTCKSKNHAGIVKTIKRLGLGSVLTIGSIIYSSRKRRELTKYENTNKTTTV